MNRFSTLILIAGVAAAFTSCKKESNSGTTTPQTNVNKIAPDGFNFTTTKNVNLNVSLKDNNNGALAGVVVSVYLPDNTAANASIFKGVTDKNGNLTGKITVPASYTQVVIDPAYIGLLHNATANINNGAITAVIGGKDGFSGDIVAQAVATNSSSSLTTLSLSNDGINFVYPSPYTSSSNAVVSNSTYSSNLGRPVYLEATSDVIDASLLSYVNASLPEGSALPNTHASFLSLSAVPDINVTAQSDVWVTFVSEGAGYLNSLAYYTYATGTPPTSVADIDKATLVFPNASAYGSGGGLKSGDKVKLGRFSAGTSIGFVLIQNAWTGSGVSINNTKFYSDYKLNPESSSSLKKHTVLLYDDVHKLFVIGFEDQNRADGSSDNDFNDLVIYATSNPVTGISTTGVSTIDKGNDQDGDGVIDELDAFPNDATKAYISYYPSASTYSTLAFEDNFPSKGDYDMNDLVVNYRYAFVSNASNQVVQMTGTYNIAAAGASFHNGFGVQLPVAASTVSSVTGQQAISNYITFASNGVEAGQSKAVIIPFDNHEALVKNPDGSFFINTLTSKDKVTGTTATVTVNFTTPLAASALSVSAFNPFLISNLRRGYEVHLPGFAPTDKANTALFGTNDDNSVPSSNRYYLSKENWPWAISFGSQFSYPLETKSITDAYPHFTDWAASGGTTFTDWYTSLTSGYRNASYIYSK